MSAYITLHVYDINVKFNMYGESIRGITFKVEWHWYVMFKVYDILNTYILERKTDRAYVSIVH